MNDISVIFGQRMVATREAKGLSLGSATELLQISRSILTEYEKGKFTPAYRTIIKIAKAYNVSIDYLIGLADEPDKRNVTAEDVCEYTGLSLQAVRGLHKSRNFKIKWL